MFTLDAVIALIVIVGVILIIMPTQQSDVNVEQVYLPGDLLKAFSVLKIGEVNNSYVSSLMAQGKIVDPNQTVLEQIGEFYAKDMPEAGLLTQSLLNDTGLEYNIGLWMNGQFIAADNTTSYENANLVWTSRQLISGVQKGVGVRGYSSRAFLGRPDKIKYFYFGGYVGDGNLSGRVDYIGNLTSASIEAMVEDRFSVYINGNLTGNFTGSSSVNQPVIYNLSTNYFVSNRSGGNIVEIKGNNLYIAGGYLKIAYTTQEIAPQDNKKYLPGITGYINLYDSLYFPQNFSYFNIFLHYKSDYQLFVNIGNVTVFNQSQTGGDATQNITNVTLYSFLDYTRLYGNNIPIRIGLYNTTYNFTQFAGATDTILSTDVSGSMGDCVAYQVNPPFNCTYQCNGVRKSCIVSDPATCASKVCGGTCNNPVINYSVNGWPAADVCNATKMDLAKSADKQFVSIVLNGSGNAVGLDGYTTSTTSIYGLTMNGTKLNQTINTYAASSSTCICCGINSAVALLNASAKIKTIVIMSDGGANIACAKQGTGDPKKDAIKAACDAYTLYNITIHTIAFNGSLQGTDFDESTLINISKCANGNYSLVNASNILQIYSQYANNILRMTFTEQTITVLQGNLTTTYLYPDSNIVIVPQSSTNTSFGYEYTIETPPFGSGQLGNFTIPADSTLLSARAVSYSGPKWTTWMDLQNATDTTWVNMYNLTMHGYDYTKLGDPYYVEIPIDQVGKGLNYVRVTIGRSTKDMVVNATYDKVIYSLLRPATGYSSIAPVANGCIWSLSFADGTNTTMKVPPTYNGTNQCNYATASFNNNDAINNAVYSLLQSLDINNDKKIEVKINPQDIQIASTQIAGIPFTYDSEVQMRLWKQ